MSDFEFENKTEGLTTKAQSHEGKAKKAEESFEQQTKKVSEVGNGHVNAALSGSCLLRVTL